MLANPKARSSFLSEQGIFLLFVGMFFVFRYYEMFSSKELIWWDKFNFVPYGKPIAMDFSEVYRFGLALFDGRDPYAGTANVYPPFLTFFCLPFQLLNQYVAFKIYGTSIFVLSFLSLFLTKKLIEKNEGIHLGFFEILFFTFLLFISYPLDFAIERGNSDIQSVMFSMFGLYLMLHEKSKWLVILFFSMGMHFKIHPGIFMLLPLFRYGIKQSFLPMLLINVGLSLVLGPKHFLSFLSDVSHISRNAYVWVGNHSMYSFYTLQFVEKGKGSKLIKYIFNFIPIASFLFFLGYRIFRTKVKDNDFLLDLFFFFIPLMCYLPSQSHDYKLIIVFCSLYYFFMQLPRLALGKASSWFYVFIIFFCGIMITRSFEMGPKGWNANKYLYLLILQMVYGSILFKKTKLSSILKT